MHAFANQIQTYSFEDDGEIPNSPLPLLVYPGVLNEYIDQMDEIFLQKGWHSTWIGSILPHHHYHSTAHEVLGVLSGEATVQFGGQSGRKLEVSPGDVLIIPAGVGHKQLYGSRDFLVVGAYPEGQYKDMRKGNPNERPEVLQNIKEVTLPSTDPVFGDDLLFLEYWGK
ncbi:hypothetical protein N780_17095 [Pontibacillus chungwhensis BH030062]|uniref:Cupin type-1 domain-containing protein n=1 Tax=Pontibacillus chungwhensis BH030062 TaxID=1385513 RepID=A0A0A2VBE2_9BACI|nr:cupin domain-containing protein [Pontibacillus chungwhensis]KGP90995.1 hypothetical protein N780_17095 [Pontibacillus chungwhensis BH030062]